jgi:proteasome lid subunit RPN8/RPN11
MRWCGRGDSNPHGLPHGILSPARLPVPPLPRPVQDSAVDVRGASESGRQLELPEDVRAALRSWGSAAYPREGCGLLIGKRGAGGERVDRATWARNVHASERPDRYEIDPAHHLAAWQAAEAEGLDVVGAWHSHPDQAAVPSETDLAEAQEGLSYVIVAVTHQGAGELRAWCLDASTAGRRFVERALRP